MLDKRRHTVDLNISIHELKEIIESLTSDAKRKGQNADNIQDINGLGFSLQDVLNKIRKRVTV